METRTMEMNYGGSWGVRLFLGTSEPSFLGIRKQGHYCRAHKFTRWLPQDVSCAPRRRVPLTYTKVCSCPSYYVDLKFKKGFQILGNPICMYACVGCREMGGSSRLVLRGSGFGAQFSWLRIWCWHVAIHDRQLRCSR